VKEDESAKDAVSDGDISQKISSHPDYELHKAEIMHIVASGFDELEVFKNGTFIEWMDVIDS